MGVIASQKVQISITNDQKLDILQFLQRLEAVEIIPQTDSKGLDPESLEAQEELLDQLDQVNKAIDTLQAAQPKKKSLFSALFDPRALYTEKTYTTLSKRQDALLKRINQLNANVETREKLIHRNTVLQDVITKAEPLKDIEIDIFGEFKYVAFIPFMLDAERAVPFIQELEDIYSDIEVESIKKVNNAYVYIAAVLKEQAKEVTDIISNKATLLTFRSEVTGSFYDMYTSSVQEKESNLKTLDKIDAKISATKLTLEEACGLKDIIQSHLNLINALHNYREATDTSSILQAWIDPRDVEPLRDALNKKFPESVLTVLESTPSEAPVILSNGGLSGQFETITRIMGLPLGGSIDPTPYVTFFFVFMFGLGFSEAGYALLLLAVSGLLLVHPRLKMGIRKVLTVIFASSLVTLVIGAMFGSWFGVVPSEVVASESLPHMQFLINMGVISFLQGLQVINPLDSVVSLMGFTVALGIVHLLLGLMLGFIQAVSQGKIWDGIFDSLSWFFFLVFGGIVLASTQGLLGADLERIGGLLLIAYVGYIFLMILALGRAMGNPLTMFAKGLYDMFFGAIGYLSDSLSYTRLVALGLATGIIAGVVGTLARLAGGGLVEQGGASLIVGYILMIVIFIFGHLFNIALNVLGTYINVGRLHFVEFFGKFFESGGVEFSPMKRSQEHIVITEE